MSLSSFLSLSSYVPVLLFVAQFPILSKSPIVPSFLLCPSTPFMSHSPVLSKCPIVPNSLLCPSPPLCFSPFTSEFTVVSQFSIVSHCCYVPVPLSVSVLLCYVRPVPACVEIADGLQAYICAEIADDM